MALKRKAAVKRRRCGKRQCLQQTLRPIQELEAPEPRLFRTTDPAKLLAAPVLPARPVPGDMVQLAPGVTRSRSGGGGPLNAGDLGRLMYDGKDKQPFHVKASNGEIFWYHENEIRKVSRGRITVSRRCIIPRRPSNPKVERKRDLDETSWAMHCWNLNREIAALDNAQNDACLPQQAADELEELRRLAADEVAMLAPVRWRTPIEDPEAGIPEDDDPCSCDWDPMLDDERSWYNDPFGTLWQKEEWSGVDEQRWTGFEWGNDIVAELDESSKTNVTRGSQYRARRRFGRAIREYEY